MRPNVWLLNLRKNQLMRCKIWLSRTQFISIPLLLGLLQLLLRLLHRFLSPVPPSSPVSSAASPVASPVFPSAFLAVTAAVPVPALSPVELRSRKRRRGPLRPAEGVALKRLPDDSYKAKDNTKWHSEPNPTMPPIMKIVILQFCSNQQCFYIKQLRNSSTFKKTLVNSGLWYSKVYSACYLTKCLFFCNHVSKVLFLYSAFFSSSPVESRISILVN
ncbi:uncharacterized protein LOC143026168 [Oratosquilla oratoria]|uniref:uncharacterized protein LOC143026168 n=1 Tax=Oratosquilla oratoria TaxID=337810 RepID=UPI003F764EE7